VTSSINQSVIDFLSSTHYDAVSTTVGLAAAAALTILLVEREAVRGFGGERAKRWIHGLDIAVFPLLLSFAVVVILRLLDLVPPAAS
jgi:hypothetical protein